MSGIFDLNGCKTRLKSIFDTENTTTATYPLSNNMDNNVQLVSKCNPDLVFTQHTKFPSLHIYPESKTVNTDTIGKNMIDTSRKGLVRMNIMGVCQFYNIENNFDDKGQKNVEILMENTELILRNNPDLQNFAGVRWVIPSDTQYGIAAFEEDAYFRVGVMSLDINIFY